MKILLLSILTSALLFCAPAFHAKKQFELSSGEAFNGTVKGDEYLNWIESDEGEILLFNKQNKRYEYAQIKEDELVPSGVEKKPHTLKKTRASKLSKEALYKLWKKKRNDELRRREQ